MHSDYVHIDVNTDYFMNSKEYIKTELKDALELAEQTGDNYYMFWDEKGNVVDYCHTVPLRGVSTAQEAAKWRLKALDEYPWFESDCMSEYELGLINNNNFDFGGAKFTINGKTKTFSWDMGMEYLNPETKVTLLSGDTFKLKEMAEASDTASSGNGGFGDLAKGIMIKSCFEPYAQKYGKDTKEYQIACVKAVNDLICLMYSYDYDLYRWDKANEKNLNYDFFNQQWYNDSTGETAPPMKPLKEICAGYAAVTEQWLWLADVRCCEIIGSARDDDHAWNIVYIDGVGYHLDVTWNDTGNSKYKYFLIGTKSIQKTHTLWDYYDDINLEDISEKDLDVSFLGIYR